MSIDGIQRWRERDQAAFERLERSLVAGTAAARATTVSATSPDGGVTITIDGQRRLQGISLNKDRYSEYTAGQLAAMVTAGMAAARRRLATEQLAAFHEQFKEEDPR